MIVGVREAPKFLLDNEFIHRGYRVNFNSIKKVLGSLFMVHNESVNVWSHLGGALLFIVFIIYTATLFGKNIIAPNTNTILPPNTDYVMNESQINNFTNIFIDMLSQESFTNFNEMTSQQALCKVIVDETDHENCLESIY